MAAANWCSRGVVSLSLLELVRAHEVEHIRVYQQSYTREVPTAITKLEPMASTDMSSLTDAYEAEFARIDGIARRLSKAIHEKKGNPYIVTRRDSEGECALRNEDSQELKNEDRP